MPRTPEAAQIAVRREQPPISPDETAGLVTEAMSHALAELPMDTKLEIYRAALVSGQLSRDAAIGIMQAIITLTRNEDDPRSNIYLPND